MKTRKSLLYHIDSLLGKNKPLSARAWEYGHTMRGWIAVVLIDWIFRVFADKRDHCRRSHQLWE